LFGRETVLGLSLIKPACPWTGGGGSKFPFTGSMRFSYEFTAYILHIGVMRLERIFGGNGRPRDL
jgi:hypothetical protein